MRKLAPGIPLSSTVIARADLGDVAASMDTSKILLYGGVAVGVWYFFFRKKSAVIDVPKELGLSSKLDKPKAGSGFGGR